MGNRFSAFKSRSIQEENFQNLSNYQTASNSESNESEKTFKRRTGTVNFGHDYEILTTINFILNMVSNNEIQDFQISVNDNHYGKFDDVVLVLETNDDTKEIYAFQLKHKSVKDIFTTDNLKETTGDFSLQEYCESMKDIKKDFTKLILYTNCKLDITKNKSNELSIEKVKKEGNKEVRTELFKVRYSQFRLNNLTKLTETSGCYKFDIIESKVDQETREKYEKFFDCFLLCSGQIDCKSAERILIDKFKKDYFCGKTEYNRFKNLIENWSKKTGKVKKLDKLWMRKAIALCILTTKIRTFSFPDSDVNENMQTIKETISKFDVSQFKEESVEILEKLWKKEKNDLKQKTKEINQLNADYSISSTQIEDIMNSDDEIITYLLWLMKAAPVIVNHDKAVEEAIKLFPESKYIIISNDYKKILHQSKTFVSLLDVKAESLPLFEKIVNKFKLCLQGKEGISIENFVHNNEKFFTSDILLKMAADNLNYGKEKENISEDYIERKLEQKLIQSDYIHHADKNTLIMIHGKISEQLSNLKCKVELVENEWTLKKFEKICNENKNFEKFRLFKSTDNENLLLRYSKGDNKDLKKYKKIILKEEKKIWESEEMNDINIVLSDLGMGKSELMKSLKSNCNSKYWVTIFNSNEIKTLLKNYENRVTEYLFIEKYKNFSSEERNFFELIDNRNLVIYVWDGIDEILNTDLERVIRTISELNAMGKIQWITGRRHLKDKLESYFGVFAMNLSFVNEMEQESYIKKRLRINNDSDEKIQKALQLIKNNFMIVNHLTILGIPLQLYMVTELFRLNMNEYLGKSGTKCTLSDLYRYFIDETFNFYWEEKCKIDENKNEDWKQYVGQRCDSYLKLCQNLSLKVLFPDADFGELKNDTKFKAKENSYSIGIITEIDGDSIRFVHLSFAEYFAACYFAENKDKITFLKEIFFKEEHSHVRFFMDLILAKDCPAHVSIIYREYDKLKEYDENLLWKRDDGGRNVLHLLCSWGESYPLISVKNNNVICKSIDSILNQKTVLDNRGCLDTLKKLQKNERLSEDSLFNLNPTSYALKCRCFRSAFILLKNVNENFTNEEMDNMLLYSVRYGNDENLHLFKNTQHLKLKFEDNSTLLHLACGSGHEEIVKKFVDYGNDVNETNNGGDTPLHFASKYGHKNIAKFLIESGAKIDVCNGLEQLPLHLASIKNHEKVAEYLINVIKTKSDINKYDSLGLTPLHWASLLGHKRIIRLLVESGSDVNQRDSEGRTPLHLAYQSGDKDSVKYLLTKGSDVNLQDNKGQTPLDLWIV